MDWRNEDETEGRLTRSESLVSPGKFYMKSSIVRSQVLGGLTEGKVILTLSFWNEWYRMFCDVPDHGR